MRKDADSGVHLSIGIHISFVTAQEYILWTRTGIQGTHRPKTSWNDIVFGFLDSILVSGGLGERD